MKTCFRCNVVKPLSEFYVHSRMADGYLNKCKECTKKDMAQRLDANRDHVHRLDKKRNEKPERKQKMLSYQKNRRRRSPEKNAAYLRVRRALKSGKLIARPCEICGSQEVQAHHDDYSKPLDVRWLCFKHHREHHGQCTS